MSDDRYDFTNLYAALHSSAGTPPPGLFRLYDYVDWNFLAEIQQRQQLPQRSWTPNTEEFLAWRPGSIPNVFEHTRSGSQSSDTFYYSEDNEWPRTRSPSPEQTRPSSPERKPYGYTPLNQDQNSIRLVEIFPTGLGKSPDLVECSLTTVSLKDIGTKTPYRALSYAWDMDDGAVEYDIVIWDWEQKDMHPHRVRKNLYSALKQLRDPRHRTFLWIDALCINQADEDEKSTQIPLMPEIYRNASTVVIWLGPARDDDRRAFEFIVNVLDPATLDKMIERRPTAETALPLWFAFAKLLDRSWFRRRWVIQEVVHAKSCQIQCGTEKADWVDFSDAVTLFAMNSEKVRRNIYAWKPFLEQPNAIAHPKSTGAWVLTRLADEAIRKPGPGRATIRRWDLNTLVMKCRPFTSSDIRDTTFALLGLASDFTPDVPSGKGSSETIIAPRYDQDACQVYVDFVKYCVERTSSLDIICQHWAQVPMDALADSPSDAPGHNWFPSWVGLDKDSAFGLAAWGATRTNGDSFVRGPDGTCQPYSASREWSQEPEFIKELRQGISGSNVMCQIMYAQGIILGRVNKCSDWVMEGTISYTCWPILGWDHRQSPRTIPDKLWRTLVADRDVSGENAPTWYRRACMHALGNVNREGNLTVSKLVSSDSQPQLVAEYLRRVQSVVWGRRFFTVNRELEPVRRHSLFPNDADGDAELVGMGSRYVREGDWVCILPGCSVPVILRGRGIRAGPVNSTFDATLIGECFVYGMMDGEAIQGVQGRGGLDKIVCDFRLF
ncbi:heterokaryon incompatibility protein-domain-containing protein [Hypoxylon sp. NC1633]|nr:heterokaryon incompatibility protein-domain-containing protein [Hypoxylon sp. NC1633]